MVREVHNVPLLLDRLSRRVDKYFHQNLVVFGSCAMELNGVELGRPVGDLDIFVSQSIFDELNKFFVQKGKSAKEGGEIPYLEIAENIEMLKSFPGVEFDDVYGRSRVLEHSRGFRVGSLSDLRDWKLEQGRPKDRDDIKRINHRIHEGARVSRKGS